MRFEFIKLKSNGCRKQQLPVMAIFAVIILLCSSLLFLFPALSQAATTPPVLLTPANMASNMDTTNIVFSWQQTGATTDYKLDLATDPNFSNLVFADFIGDSRTEYKLGIRLNANATYYWRVTAAMPEISTSPAFSFTTKAGQSAPASGQQQSATVPPSNQTNPALPNIPASTGQSSQSQTTGLGKSPGTSAPSAPAKTKGISNNLPFIIAAAAIAIALVTLLSILVLRRRKAALEYGYDQDIEIRAENEYVPPPADLPPGGARKRPAPGIRRKDNNKFQDSFSKTADNPWEQVSVTCSYCGFIDYPGSGTCRNCGNKMNEPASQFTCPVCGGGLIHGANACPNCGTTLSW